MPKSINFKRPSSKVFKWAQHKFVDSYRTVGLFVLPVYLKKFLFWPVKNPRNGPTVFEAGCKPVLLNSERVVSQVLKQVTNLSFFICSDVVPAQPATQATVFTVMTWTNAWSTMEAVALVPGLIVSTLQGPEDVELALRAIRVMEYCAHSWDL